MAKDKGIKELLKEPKLSTIAEMAKWEPLRSKGFEVTFKMPPITPQVAAEAYHQSLIVNNPSTEPSDVVAAFEEGAEWALERVKRYIENHVQSVAWLESMVMSCTNYMLGDKFKERLVDDIRNGKI